MAVYEQTYKQYLGKLTPEWNRFLVIPRHAFHDVFKSKLFTAFFVDRKSTRLNSSHIQKSRMPSSA